MDQSVLQPPPFLSLHHNLQEQQQIEPPLDTAQHHRNGTSVATPQQHQDGVSTTGPQQHHLSPQTTSSVDPINSPSHHPSTTALLSQLEAAITAGTQSHSNEPTTTHTPNHIAPFNSGTRDAAEDRPAEPSRPSVPNGQKSQPRNQGPESEIEESKLVPAPSQKDAVRALRKYTTLTNAEIFRRVGVSTSGGYRYLRGEGDKGEPGEKGAHKETRGRKRKLDEEVVRRVIHEIETQPVGEKTKSWEELCKSAGVTEIAPVTMKRAVENAGYYKCSHCQRGKPRCEWAGTVLNVLTQWWTQ